jgi:hypothetical protein
MCSIWRWACMCIWTSRYRFHAPLLPIVDVTRTRYNDMPKRNTTSGMNPGFHLLMSRRSVWPAALMLLMSLILIKLAVKLLSLSLTVCVRALSMVLRNIKIIFLLSYRSFDVIISFDRSNLIDYSRCTLDTQLILFCDAWDHYHPLWYRANTLIPFIDVHVTGFFQRIVQSLTNLWSVTIVAFPTFLRTN